MYGKNRGVEYNSGSGDGCLVLVLAVGAGISILAGAVTMIYTYLLNRGIDPVEGFQSLLRALGYQ